MSIRVRSFLAAVSTLCVLAGGLLFASAPALASKGYVLVNTIGTAGSGNGEFSSPTGVAVNDSTDPLVEPAAGDVYVVDEGDDRVERFSSTGVYIGQFNGSGTVEVEPGKVEVEAPAPTGAFSSPEAIAVDDSHSALDPSNGDVYVADTGHGVVDKFSSTGTYIGQLKEIPGGEKFDELLGVAVDPEGNVWVLAIPSAGEASSRAYEFSDTGSFVQAVGVYGGRGGSERGGFGLAADVSYFYATLESGEVGRFSSSGAGFKEGLVTGTGITGLAVDSATHSVFVDKASNIEEFGPFGEPFRKPVAATIPARAGGLSESHGIAVNGETGMVYATQRAAGNVEVFSDLAPEAITGAATNSGIEGSETLHGTVNPEGQPVSSCEFEYGTSTSYGSTAQCSTNPGSGSVEVAVSANLTNLIPATTYHYRLVAGNEQGGDNPGLDRTFVALGHPAVSGESVSDVGQTSATLNATIEAAALPTSYHFEYGTSAAYGLSTPEVELSGEEESVAVASVVSGLAPETTYHFRVVAKNSLGEVPGVDETFRTFPGSSGLPDGRVYEMVTPVENHDANAYDPELNIGGNLGEYDNAAEVPFLVSSSGESVTYPGDASPEGNGAGGGPFLANQYVASRSSGKWEQHDISPRGHDNAEYVGFSPELSASVLQAGGTYKEKTAILEEAPAKYKVLYERDPAGGLRALLKSASLIEPPGEDFDQFAGGSEDYQSLLFETAAKLTPKAAEGHNLYQESGDGQPELVNVLPGGATEPDAVFGGPSTRRAATQDEAEPEDYSHDISANGGRVFWSSIVPEGEANERQPTALYMHEPGAATVQIDASQAGGPGGGARFWDASEDGDKVFFTDDASAELTTDTVAGSGANLYEYEVDSHTLKDLTPGTEAGVEGVLGTAEGEGGSYVYFAANGVLAQGAATGTCEGESETRTYRESKSNLCSLYVWHDGVTTFIARLSASDGLIIAPVSPEYEIGDWVPDLAHRTSEVTPSGEDLLFESQRDLTGYENEGLTEVYVYDASSGELSCASCDPSGEPIQPSKVFDEGNGGTHKESELAGMVDSSFSSTESGRWMSDDGDQVFFDSAVPLVPEATNGLIDVYEWERDGSGSCKTAGGCVSLLSSGKSDDNSYLYGTSASGDDTFFVTRSQLVEQDGNENFNVYDAHAGGLRPPAASACTGTGCQGVPQAPPIFSTPASVTFAGVGNFGPPSSTKAAVKPKPKAKSLTRAQKLVKALKACKKKKRKGCEAAARKKYGASKAKAKKKSMSRKGAK